MITMTRTGLLLTLSADTIPAQGSSGVPISFVNDPDTYTGYTIQPLAGWYKNGCKQSAVCRYADGTITVPAAAFQQNGEIMLAVALIDPSDANHIEVTQPASAYIIPAPNDPTELPDEDTWQAAVDEFVTQVMQPYQTNIQGAIDTANAASQAANEAARTANAASQAATNTSNAINEAIEDGDFIPQISRLQLRKARKARSRLSRLQGIKLRRRSISRSRKVTRAHKVRKANKAFRGQKATQVRKGQLGRLRFKTAARR